MITSQRFSPLDKGVLTFNYVGIMLMLLGYFAFEKKASSLEIKDAEA